MTAPTLAQVHETYKKWIHYENTSALDVILATALSQRMNERGEPLWIIYVAPTGGGKTEKIRALDDGEHNTYLLHRLTPRTIVSGKVGADDLAKRIDGKLVLIPDFASILQMRTEEKAELWAQLRDLYDGYAGLDSGSGKNAKYSGLHVTFIAATTSAIDDQILVHQALGTRELFLRDDEQLDTKELVARVTSNLGHEIKMRDELHTITQAFLEGIPESQVPEKIDPESEATIQQIAIDLAILRAHVPTDGYTGDVIGLPVVERPTRVLKQMLQLFKYLKALDPNYDNKRAIVCLQKVASSSVDPLRLRVLSQLCQPKLLEGQPTLETKTISTHEVSDALHIGYKTSRRRLAELVALGLADADTDWRTSYGKEEPYSVFTITSQGKGAYNSLIKGT